MKDVEEMDSALRTVIMSHLSDLQHELGFLSTKTDTNNETSEYILEKMRTRMEFLKFLAMTKVDSKQRIFPESEYMKMKMKNWKNR